MTPVQIAYFKHFMYDSGIVVPFICNYNKMRIGSNPKYIEAWLQKASVEDVIMKAFTFRMNHAYGYDFWKDVDDKWQAYWGMHEKNFSNLNYIYLKGTFKILRTNWNNEKYWAKESMYMTYIRMNMTPPDGFVSDEPKPEEEVKEEISAAPTTDSQDPLEGFEFFEVDTRVGCRLGSSEASLNFKSGSYKITFNGIISEGIIKADMKFVRLAKSKTGDICFILNKKEGTRLSKSHSNRNGKYNISINSKDIATKLKTILNVKSDYCVLMVNRIESSTEYLIYKITKKTL